MNKNKFDGPSFVNPQHTSQNLNSGNYQTPQVNFNDQKNNIVLTKNSNKNTKGPRGGWDDDDDVPQKKVLVNSNKNIKNFNFANKPEVVPTQKEEEVKIENSNSYVNYWDSENSKKIQNSTLKIEYETKLIDEILKPTGVTIKPSDIQLKDFLKRLKSLDKNIVLNILLEKLKNYENMGDSNQIKILTVILFLNFRNYFM